MWICLGLAFSTQALTHCAVVLMRATQVQFLAYFLILLLSLFPSFTFLNKTWQKAKNKIKNLDFNLIHAINFSLSLGCEWPLQNGYRYTLASSQNLL